LSLQAVAQSIRVVMNALYALCMIVAGTALVLISAIMPWAVYTRYVLNSAASWPEPTAVLLMIVLTFFGAAACYRVGLHMRMSFFVSLLPPPWQRATGVLVEALMALIALFMVNWGGKLVAATWQNSIADFPALFLFVIERLTIGAPPAAGHVSRAAFE
jgi:TRAP-type C4-dicarboxylate transport system permease small subunit